MSKHVYPIALALLTQAILMPLHAFAQVSGWSAGSSGSGIGPTSAISGPINTPGSVGATFAPQGGIGIQNYGNANLSVTGTSAPAITGTVGTSFVPQGGIGVQNYGTVSPGGLPTANLGIQPGGSANAGGLPSGGIGVQPATTSGLPSTGMGIQSPTANPGMLPNTGAGLVPLPGFGSSTGGQSGFTYGGLSTSHP
jgi:hypothetical protein